MTEADGACVILLTQPIHDMPEPDVPPPDPLAAMGERLSYWDLNTLYSY